MGQGFKETAHLKTDKQKYDENFDRIFGKKENKQEDKNILEVVFNQSFGDFKVYVIFQSENFKKEIVIDYDTSLFHISWLILIMKSRLQALTNKNHDIRIIVNSNPYLEYLETTHEIFCEDLDFKLHAIKHYSSNLERLLS